MTEGLERGYLSFRFRGEKLRGDYTLSQPESVPPGQAPDEADELS
jgi:hypothetical protein